MIVSSAAALRRRVTTFGWQVVDFIFPPQCPFCGAERGDPDREAGGIEIVCHNCVEALTSVPPDRCLRCSAPVGPHLDTSAGCIYCSGDVYSFERVYSLGVYGDLLRSAVLSAKHNGGGPAAAALARLFCDREQVELKRLKLDVVIPIPHHWTERSLRSQLAPVTLSRVIARRLRIRWCGHALKKTSRTPKQVNLTPTDRRRNLRDAFRVARASRLAGKRILLVDDVLTTGTTAHRATRVLKKAGAASVHVAVVARGVGQNS